MGLVALSILATASLAFYYVRSVQKLNRLQFQTAIINRNRALVNALVSESVEYSKRNPAIDPILQAVGVKPKSGAPQSLPASKP